MFISKSGQNTIHQCDLEHTSHRDYWHDTRFKKDVRKRQCYEFSFLRYCGKKGEFGVPSFMPFFLLQIRGEPSLQPDIRLGPANLTVGAGDTARLDCRVRSAQMPHIKWLRRLEAGSRIEDDGEIIPVGEDKYRIIASSRYYRF